MLKYLRYGTTAAILSTTVSVTVHAQADQNGLPQTIVVTGDSAFQQLNIDPQALGNMITNALTNGNFTVDNVDGSQQAGDGNRSDLLKRLLQGNTGFKVGSGTILGNTPTPVDRSGITITPSINAVSTNSHTATFRLTNPSNDSVPLDFIVQSVNPQTLPFVAAGGLRGGSDTQWSLARWVSDVPRNLVLAPHESRTVTMHVAVPANATAGKYSAYVVVYYAKPIIINESTDLSGGGLDFLSDTTAHGFPRNSYVLGQLVYVKKP